MSILNRICSKTKLIVFMNKYLSFIAITFILVGTLAQNLVSQTENIGIGTTTPDNSAVLHITFSNPANPKGLLIPKLTTTERNLINSPANGLIIYNSTTNNIEYNSGTSGTPFWIVLFSSGNLTLANGNIFVGNGSNQAVAVLPSGDVTISNTGATTIGADAVTTGKILDGTIATGDLADGAVTGAKLENSGVTASSYGSATQVPVVTVDAKGRVTGVTNTTITGTSPVGSALTSGNIIVGSGTNVAAAVGVTGDVTISNTGVTSIATDAVTTGKILDGTIANADINAGAEIDVTKLGNGTNDQLIRTNGTNVEWFTPTFATSSTAVGGDLTGTIANAQIAADAVTSAEIANNAVGETEISDNAVTNAKLADNAVGNAEMADNAINTAEIVNGAVINEDISSTAEIAVTKLGNGTNDQLIRTNGTNVEWFTPTFATSSTAVGGDLTGTIANAQIAADAVTSAEIADNAVGNSELIDNAVNTAEITNLAVTTGKIADDAVTTNKILNLNVTTPKIADDAITSDKLADNAVLSINITDGAIVNADIADGTITSAKLAGSIAANKLTLTDGQIFVGNASNQAASVALSGDASITNTGALTVSRINGTSVVNTTPTANQVLAYNGTAWAPKTMPTGKSRVRAYRTTSNQTLASSTTPTLVVFNATNYNTNSDFNTTTGVFTAPQDGYYFITARVRINFTTSGTTTSIFKNDNLYSYGNRMTMIDQGTQQQYDNEGYLVSDIVYLTNGETIDIRIEQNTLTSMNVLAGESETYLSIHLLSE